MKPKYIAYLIITIAIIIFISVLKFEILRTNYLGNITAEALGVSIELLVVIFVLDRWRKNEELYRKIKMERRLREFLIFYLKKNFDAYPPSCQSGDFYGCDYEQNQEALGRLIVRIEECDISNIDAVKIRSYCKEQKDFFYNLLPVASELSNDHFKSWNRITYFMNAISSESEDVTFSTIKILQHIKIFDHASFSKKLYVGAHDSCFLGLRKICV